jgi:hypothetical protein
MSIYKFEKIEEGYQKIKTLTLLSCYYKITDLIVNEVKYFILLYRY